MEIKEFVMSIFGKIAKAGALMFAVGVLLALAAPVIANGIGVELLGKLAFEHAIATPVLWTGAFFGAFGAIHAAVTPLFDKVLGAETAEPHTCQSLAKSQGKGVCQSLEQELSPEKSPRYREQLESSRGAAAITQL